ncbi:MAG: hypothetical protein GXY40_03985 [Syntrophomonadaceae bacterium]|nr:hypothetical protein [Syntrophomonadaceae bacterium]
MTEDKREQFELFLAKSFADGVMFSELRLSAEEWEYLQNRYPQASLNRISSPEYADGKAWYEVKLSKGSGV